MRSETGQKLFHNCPHRSCVFVHICSRTCSSPDCSLSFFPCFCVLFRVTLSSTLRSDRVDITRYSRFRLIYCKNDLGVSRKNVRTGNWKQDLFEGCVQFFIPQTVHFSPLDPEGKIANSSLWQFQVDPRSFRFQVRLKSLWADRTRDRGRGK